MRTDKHRHDGVTGAQGKPNLPREEPTPPPRPAVHPLPALIRRVNLTLVRRLEVEKGSTTTEILLEIHLLPKKPKRKQEDHQENPKAMFECLRNTVKI